MFKLIKWFFLGKKAIKSPKGTAEDVSKDVVAGFFALPLVILGALGLGFMLWGFGIFGNGSVWLVILAGVFFFFFFIVLMSQKLSTKVAAKMTGSAYDVVTSNSDKTSTNI